MIGKENYFLSGDGLLMPAKKDQAPPGSAIFQGVAEVMPRANAIAGRPRMYR